MLCRTGPTLLRFITGCGPSPSCPLLWTLPRVSGQVGVLLDSETGRAALWIHAPTRAKSESQLGSLSLQSWHFLSSVKSRVWSVLLLGVG